MGESSQEGEILSCSVDAGAPGGNALLYRPRRPAVPLTRQVKAKPAQVTERASASDAVRLFFVVEVGGRVDLLDVVEILKGVDQLLHLFSVSAGELDFVEGLVRDFGDDGFDAGGFEGLGNGVEGGRFARDFDGAVFVGDDVVGAGFKGDLHHGVFGRDAGGEDELADVLEHEGDGAFRAEVAAVLRERVADVGDRADAVVGRAVDDERSTADAVAFVADFLVGDAFELAGALENGVGDGVLGHVAGAGLDQGEAETGVGLRLAAAHAGGHDDFTNQLRPEVGALGVLTALAMLDVGPLGMT